MKMPSTKDRVNTNEQFIDNKAFLLTLTHVKRLIVDQIRSFLFLKLIISVLIAVCKKLFLVHS